MSVSLAWSLVGSSRSIASAFVTPRYASRNSTTSYRHPVPVSDRDQPVTRRWKRLSEQGLL
jgi:hypothetical protein